MQRGFVHRQVSSLFHLLQGGFVHCKISSTFQIAVSMGRTEQEEKVVEMESLPEPKIYQILLLIGYLEKNFVQSARYSQSCSGHPAEEATR